MVFNKPTLTRLPTELHFEIANHLRVNANWSDLCALSLSCSLFRHIAQKALYTSIEISHQMPQLEKIHCNYEHDYGSEPGLDEASSRAAIDSPTLAHPLRILASGVTEHHDLLRHVRTLIIDCGCYPGCEHNVLIIQIANLFLDHLFNMTGLRGLELRNTLIIESDIYSGIIALACHSLQEITLDLAYPPVVSLQSLADHDSEPLLCTRLDIFMDAEDLSEFYVWFLNRCRLLTVLSLRGDILEILTSIKGLTFRNLDRLEIESGSTELAEPLSAFLQSNPSVINLHLCIPVIVGSDITLSEDSLPNLRSIHAPIQVLCKLLPGRPIVKIRSDLKNPDPQIGLVPQLIDAVGLSSASVIEEFAVGVSPMEDLDRTLEKVLECMKSVKHLRLHDLPHDGKIILDFITRITLANFTCLKSLSLTRDLQIPDETEEVLHENSLPEDMKGFRPLLVAVHELLPSVVEFTVTCGRTAFFAERVDGRRTLEDGGWWVSTTSLILSEIQD